MLDLIAFTSDDVCVRVRVRLPFRFLRIWSDLGPVRQLDRRLSHQQMVAFDAMQVVDVGR